MIGKELAKPVGADAFARHQDRIESVRPTFGYYFGEVLLVSAEAVARAAGNRMAVSSGQAVSRCGKLGKRYDAALLIEFDKNLGALPDRFFRQGESLSLFEQRREALHEVCLRTVKAFPEGQGFVEKKHVRAGPDIGQYGYGVRKKDRNPFFETAEKKSLGDPGGIL